MAQLIISQVQRNLIINSDIINSYPGLMNLLNEHKKVDVLMVEKCIDMDEFTQEILLTKGAFSEIYDMAKKEWIEENNHDIDEKKCMLCNQPNKDIYYILNTINGKRLNVGSNCIQGFQDAEQVIEKRSEITKRTKRKIKFYKDKRFVNLDNMLNYYKKQLDNSPYLVEWSLYNNANKFIDQIKSIRNDYFEGKKNSACFNDIEIIIKKLNRIITVEIVNKNKSLENKKYACNKEIVDWLYNRSNKDNSLIESIIKRIRLNDSLIGRDTITEIAFPKFIEQYKNEYEVVLKDVFSDLRIVNEGGITKLYTNIKNKDIKDVAFCCTPHIFMKKLGDIVFLDRNYVKDKLSFEGKTSLDYLFSNVLSLYEDDYNIYTLYSILNKKFRFEFEFLFDYELNTTYIKSKENNTYIELDGTTYVVRYILRCLENSNADFIELCKSALLSNKKLHWIKISNTMEDTITKCRNYSKEF